MKFTAGERNGVQQQIAVTIKKLKTLIRNTPFFGIAKDAAGK